MPKYQRDYTRDDEELEELERRRTDTLLMNDEQPEDDNKPESEQPQVDHAENENWKKRYGDLRAYEAKKDKEAKERIKELEDRLAALSDDDAPKPPKSKEEVEEWIRKYPDVAGIIETIVETRIADRTKKGKERLESLEKEIKEKEYKSAAQEAYAKVVAAHGDWPELKKDQKFLTWLDEQPQAIQDTLRKNATDAGSAIKTIKLYKYEMGIADTKRNDNDAARTVGKGRSGGAPRDTSKAKWSESKVARLSDREYEQYEEEISAAIRAGEFDYDLKNAARA